MNWCLKQLQLDSPTCQMYILYCIPHFETLPPHPHPQSPPHPTPPLKQYSGHLLPTPPETERSSFWWKFRHWPHRKLLFWQISMQPVTHVSSGALLVCHLTETYLKIGHARSSNELQRLENMAEYQDSCPNNDHLVPIDWPERWRHILVDITRDAPVVILFMYAT